MVTTNLVDFMVTMLFEVNARGQAGRGKPKQRGAVGTNMEERNAAASPELHPSRYCCLACTNRVHTTKNACSLFI